ncbi:methyltransferase domain-containing protein [Hymenobacter aerilatus]|uniref:Methyltransferase domain-containing protein n=1 Tax=Hymenobacter aerilatus TaxID=2932251 RepID=A0A8T9T1N9_9BACT|nr:methyltransferase domain-containing protein [Hymenobacter aerilatus]UOR06006.1 methyltransferase domain-containing protein [Hymenobacter aerilatus]
MGHKRPTFSTTFTPTPLKGFDFVAPFYDALARLVFGRALRRAQQTALAGLPPGTPHLLIVGGGTGWILGDIWQQCPQARVLYVEASAQMLAQAQAWQQQHQPQRSGQIVFRWGTEAALLPAEQFDAVLTFFLLDLFAPSELQRIVQQLNAARRPGAPWLLADFTTPTRWWHHGLLAVMYRFFRLTAGISAQRLPPIQQALATVGLRPQQRSFLFGRMMEATVFTEWVPD